MNIVYTPYEKIDKVKWDACITHSLNGLIYAESFYLDTMATNWDAIILGDYQAVMPLPWRKKFGISYLYQPAFSQQGGIFCNRPISIEEINAFIQMAMQQFSFAEISLNYLNTGLIELNNVTIRNRNNFVLPLGRGYEKIQNEYSTYIKRKIKNVANAELTYSQSTNYSEAIDLYEKLYQHRIKGISTADYTQFKKLCLFYSERNRILIRQVHSANNELLAQILFLKDNNRLYNIIPCITEKGKVLLANYFLYNELIKEFAVENIMIDFEGSNIPGVAYFYEKFTKENQQYPTIKFNTLPWIIKLFKK